jgi:predicted permease
LPDRVEPSRWRRYLRFWGPNVDADIGDELRYHIDMRTQDFIARGMTPAQATDAARQLFGDPAEISATLREHDTRVLRQTRRADMLDDLLQDIRYGARQLRNAPRFTITAVLVLALGIGANTAMFSAIDAAFLRPLPFANPDRLVSLNSEAIDLDFDLASGFPKAEPSIGDVASDSSVFLDVAAYASGGLNLSGGLEPTRVNITYVTNRFFTTLGRSPAVGRLPVTESFAKGGPKTIILADNLWRRQFGGDRDVIGRIVALNGVSYVVAGVMPADFRFPANVDLWIPLPLPYGMDVMPAFRNYVPAQFIARLAAGATVAQATQHLTAIRSRISAGKREATASALVQPLQTKLVGDRRTALLVLMGSATLLLLIACANVTNLLLVRASTRQRELALRVVLGATRGRMLRQLIVESLLLALVGGVVAVFVALASLRALIASMPPTLAGVAPPRIDARVLGFTLLLAALTSVVFGLWPAVGASRPDLGDAMKIGAGATRRRSGLARGALVVFEMTLALMLLVGAGLMIESLRELLQVDTGMQTANIVTARLTLAAAKYPGAAKAQFLSAVVDRLSHAPGIDAAAAVSALPMEGVVGISLRVTPEDAPDDKARSAYGAYLMATPGYFAVMGAALRGADLPSAVDTTHRVAVINRALADKLWPGQDPVGRRLIFGSPRTVIGVVNDMRTTTLDKPAPPQMYFPMAEQPQSYAAVVARGSVNASSIEARVRDAVRATDVNQPLYAVRTMSDVIASSVGSRRTNTFLLTTFGAVALVLAGVGVYGVLSYGVTQRTREIGVRVALGAQRSDVVRLVVREGILLAGFGIAIGLAGAYALSRTLSSILYQVSPHDIRVFATAPLVLGAIALLAVLLPAMRATRVDAMTALRTD